MISILVAVLAVPAAYWLPGAALASLFEWRGFGRLARALAPFPLSIVITPVLLNLPAAVVAYIPNPIVLGIVTVVLFAAGWILARLGRRPVLTLRPRSTNPGSRKELLFATLFLAAVAAIAVIPRLHLLIYGSDVYAAGISDFYWHLSELTAIARGGLPAHHYIFPDLSLVYYYGSWIYPAMLAGISPLGDSLMRLLNLHALVNLLVFLGVLLAVLRMNLGSARSRWFALIFLTLAGGYDFFTGPSLSAHEWWQSTFPALVSQVQIPSMLTTYIWVPQHVAGAIAFLLLFALWRNVRGSLAARAILAVLALAFAFETSAFVFFSALVAITVWALLYRRAMLRWRVLLPAAGLAVLFLLAASPQIGLTLGQGGIVGWGGFRVVLAEAATGTSYLRSVILDQVLTLLAFPVVVSILLTIEIGLAFVVFAVWAFRTLGRRIEPWRRWLMVFPLAYLPFAFLLIPPNFGMRGMIPVQIVIVLAAALCIEEMRPHTRWQSALLTYGLIVLAGAQILSNSVEWFAVARPALSQTFRLADGFLPLPVPSSTFSDGTTTLLQPYSVDNSYWEYIDWTNRNLPKNALVVEVGLPADFARTHLLERMRFVNPADVEAAPSGVRDLTLVGRAAVDRWWASLGPGTDWDKALRSAYYTAHRPPVYVIVHGNAVGPEGTPVYEDRYVSIYLIADGG